MACMCDDLYCASCGPAQGGINAVFEKLTKFLKGNYYDLNGALMSGDDAAPLIEAALDNGEEDGLVRLTDFILGLMNESFQAGRQAEIEAQNDAQTRFVEWLEGASDD